MDGMIPHWGMVRRIDAERATVAAVLGYLFPALATLAGTVAGALVGHSDGSMALGAAAGFAASLVAARIALAWTPGLSPAPRILPHDSLSSPFPQEQHHD